MFCKEELDSKEKIQNYFVHNYLVEHEYTQCLVKMSRILKGHTQGRKGLANTQLGQLIIQLHCCK